MGLLDGVKRDSIDKKESIINILPTVTLNEADYKTEQPPEMPPEGVLTDAEAKGVIATALHEADKIKLPADSPLLKKRNKDGTEVKKKSTKKKKKSTKKTSKKGKKIVIKKPKDASKMEVKTPLKKKALKKTTAKKETPPDEDIPPVNMTITTAEPVEIVPYVQSTPQVIPIQQAFPSIEELKFMMERRNMLKKELIDPETDYLLIKGKNFMLKSGWRKFIEGFRISIDIISVKVYRFGTDVVAEYRVKVVTPFGQFAVADGTKSKSEYWSDRYENYGSYNLHNLKATARTRAINIAVSDLVGHGEVSAEEAQTNEIVERSPLFDKSG